MSRHRSIGTVIPMMVLVTLVSVALALTARSHGVFAQSAIAPAVVGTSVPSTGLPKGVTEAFATQMYGDQLASQEQIGLLINKKIRKFVFNGSTRRTNDASIALTTQYTDWTVRKGKMAFQKIRGMWYFSYVTVAGAENIGYPGLQFSDVNMNVVRQMIQSQDQNQQLVVGTIRGDYRMFEVEQVIMGTGTARVKGKLTPKRGRRFPAEFRLITSGGKWFFVGFSYSS